MSLLEPTFFQKYRIWIILGGCAAALIAIFALFQWGSNLWFWHGVDKNKAAIKEQLANIANREQVIRELQIEQAVEKDRAAEAVKQYANSVNASNQARAETNAALANLANAKNSNAVNVTVEDLEKKLDALEK